MTMKTRERVKIDDDVALSVREAARRLGITVSRLYRIVREGGFSAVYFAKRADLSPHMYVKRSDVEEYRRRRDRWLKLHGRSNGR